MRISSLDGESIGRRIPNVKYLYLDKNLLNNWDQYFDLIQNLPQLNTLTLTENMLVPLKPEVISSKTQAQLVSQTLRILVLINMRLDWAQIQILSPALIDIEELWLSRNICSHIGLTYQVNLQHFKFLKLLDLEQNGICDWDQIAPFGKLKFFEQLILNINNIAEIKYQEGAFPGLLSLSLKENLIENMTNIDILDKFPLLAYIRLSDNPFISKYGNILARQMVIGKIRKVKRLNGSAIRDVDRKDAELFYIKRAYEEYLVLKKQKEEEKEPAEEDKNSEMVKFMKEEHPRWDELVEIYGNPAKMLNEKKDAMGSSLQQHTATITLIAQVVPPIDKPPFEKKLPLNISVQALKGINIYNTKHHCTNINSFYFNFILNLNELINM